MGLSDLGDDLVLITCCCGTLLFDDFDKLGDDCVVLDEFFADNAGLKFDGVWTGIEDEGESVAEEVDVEVVVAFFVVLGRRCLLYYGNNISIEKVTTF